MSHNMQNEPDNKGLNIIEFLHIINKWRSFIFINFIIISVLAAVISLIIPKTYQAQSIILPVSSSDDIMMPIGLQGFGSSLLGLGESDEANRLMAILESRTVMQQVVILNDLQSIYNEETIEDAIESLRDFSEINFQDDGTILVLASAKTRFLPDSTNEENTRQLAADISNSLVRELDKTNKNLKSKHGKFTRMFIEERLNNSIADLDAAEDSINSFQSRFGMVSLPEQIEAAIASAAQLEQTIVMQEIKFATKRKILGSEHPELIVIELELTNLKNKLQELMRGVKSDSTKDEFLLFPVFSDMPDLITKYFRLEREFEIQKTIYTFLVQEYEEAKIQETRDTPTLHIIDEAVPPIKRNKPQRSIIVLVSGFIALLFSLFFVFISESLSKLKTKNPEDYTKLIRVIQSFKWTRQDSSEPKTRF